MNRALHVDKHTHIHLKSRVTLHHSSSERKVLTFNIFLLHQGMFRNKKFFFCFIYFLEFSCTASSVSFAVHLLNPRAVFTVAWTLFSDEESLRVCVLCVIVCLGRREARNEVCTSWVSPPSLPRCGSHTFYGGLLKGVGCTTHLLWVMVHKKRISVIFVTERERGAGQNRVDPFPHRHLTHRNGSSSFSHPPSPPRLEFCPWRPGEQGLLLVWKQQQDQPTEAQQQGQADGLGSTVRQTRGGKSGVSLVAPQSVVLVYLQENGHVLWLVIHLFR